MAGAIDRLRHQIFSDGPGELQIEDLYGEAESYEELDGMLEEDLYANPVVPEEEEEVDEIEAIKDMLLERAKSRAMESGRFQERVAQTNRKISRGY